MKTGSRALPSARVAAPASRNSLTRRSCNVLFARSTRPLAGLELAHMMSMLSACRAMEIGKGRLALDKLQMHQPAGRGVDKHQQGALRAAVLKPPMLAAAAE